jgi:hypothetical protein
MAKRASLLLVFLGTTFVLIAGVWGSASARVDPIGLVAHEWGTFTTVAGPDGLAVDWLPLGGPTDLPCFVERYTFGVFKGFPSNGRSLTYETARANLRSKVRMETPVVYFYSPDDASVDVRVTFPRGLMTEWYPKATVTQPDAAQSLLRPANHAGVIEWRNVRVLPNRNPRFATEPGESHYYAARETDAAPISVNGQQEKFLFYRGVAGFDVPISAEALNDGSVRVKNLGSGELRSVIFFENHGGRLSYRVHGAVRDEATIAQPAESASLAALRADLERILTSAGLYPKEAHAMVATWRDSWFEEGARVFYVLAPRDVDRILPLTISPAPREIARVFVGRMEAITPSVLRSAQKAIDAGDTEALERYGRFLGPITDRLLATDPTNIGKARLADVTRAAFAAYIGRGPSCRAGA